MATRTTRPAPTAAPDPRDLARITRMTVEVYVLSWTADPPGCDSNVGRREAVYFHHADGSFLGGCNALAELFAQQARGAEFPAVVTHLPLELP